MSPPTPGRRTRAADRVEQVVQRATGILVGAHQVERHRARDVRVLAGLHQEQRRRAFRFAGGQRALHARGVHVLLVVVVAQVRGDEFLAANVVRIAETHQRVGDWPKGDYAGDRRRDIRCVPHRATDVHRSAAMRPDVRLDRREQHQVAAGRTPDQADRIRIDVVVRRIRPYMANAGRDVLHRAGMLAVAAVPEVQREHREPVPGQILADHRRRVPVIAGPSAAMHHHDRAAVAQRRVAMPIALGQQIGRVGPTVDQRMGLNAIQHGLLPPPSTKPEQSVGSGARWARSRRFREARPVRLPRSARE